jgi:hypothetical protein
MYTIPQYESMAYNPLIVDSFLMPPLYENDCRFVSGSNVLQTSGLHEDEIAS